MPLYRARTEMLLKVLHDDFGPLMDLDDLASTLKVKKATLYQQIYLGTFKIPRIKNGKKYLFLTSDVANFLAFPITQSANN